MRKPRQAKRDTRPGAMADDRASADASRQSSTPEARPGAPVLCYPVAGELAAALTASVSDCLFVWVFAHESPLNRRLASFSLGNKTDDGERDLDEAGTDDNRGQGRPTGDA